MKLSLENIKWLTIGGLIVYIILLQQCNGGNSPCPDPIISTVTKTVTHTDTVEIHDTVPKSDTEAIDSIFKYESIVEDSMLSGVIVSNVNGVLVSQDFTYTTKFPKYIKTHTIDSVTTTVTVEEAKNYLSIGGEIGGSQTSFNISPRISFYTKKGFTYSYRYGIIDRSHNVGVSKRIRFRR
jgi:ribosome-binding factor A